ncbi:hypothetical protein M885DRAFT_505248 [Pelagophyceae sp. CCMP2097]|nr:hypothetical protein M885DRAFT_505248 [Pelagophyceae sp. CCMP2097]
MTVRCVVAAVKLDAAGFPGERVNAPVLRRDAILQALQDSTLTVYTTEVPSSPLTEAAAVHDMKYLDFLQTAWPRWAALEHRDETFYAPGNAKTAGGGSIPALVAGYGANRDAAHAPEGLMGQVCYFATDRETPIFCELASALESDVGVSLAAAKMLCENVEQKGARTPIYAAVTLPGHHAAAANYSGYCYVNHASLIASKVRDHGGSRRRVAILDVDYHCGDGSMGIFWKDADVLVVSIHCDPNCEYPYTAGFASQTGDAVQAPGATLCLPLAPRATMASTYEKALQAALAKIEAFQPEALVVSLGLDALIWDPVAVPGAGFDLEISDFATIGRAISQLELPTCVVQEGGYDLDRVGPAVREFFRGFLS